MIAALDVHYGARRACAAGVLFEDWASEQALVQVAELMAKIEPYEPGSFYKRELPGLLLVANRLGKLFDAMIIDGYVWLGPEHNPGLGAHLFDSLERAVPVIGVAKTPFKAGAGALPVFRGRSRKPLYVTAAGMGAMQAAKNIENMHGPNRIPTMLKIVDRLSRQI